MTLAYTWMIECIWLMGSAAVAGVPTATEANSAQDWPVGSLNPGSGDHKMPKDSGVLVGISTGWQQLMACPGMGAGHAGRMTTRRCTTR